MNHDEAIQLALGYAWASEDAGRDCIAGTPLLFAQAFAQGWQDYRDEQRCSMIPVRDAYERWQASNGLSIFKTGDTTADHQKRTAEHRAAMARIWG